MIKRVLWAIGVAVLVFALLKTIPGGATGVLDWSRDKGEQTGEIIKKTTKDFSLDGIEAPKLLPTPTATPAPKKQKKEGKQ